MARLLLLLMGVFPVLPLAAPKRGAGDTGEAAGNWALTLSGTSRNGSLGVEIAQQTSPASLESDTLAMLPTDVQQPIAQVFRQVQVFVQLCASEEEDPRNNPQWPSVLATLNENLFRATEYVDMDVIIEVARQRCEAKLSKSQLERAMQLMAETFVARSRPECGAVASSTRD